MYLRENSIQIKHDLGLGIWLELDDFHILIVYRVLTADTFGIPMNVVTSTIITKAILLNTKRR